MLQQERRKTKKNTDNLNRQREQNGPRRERVGTKGEKNLAGRSAAGLKKPRNH